MTPIHELTVSLPEAATVFGNKDYTADPDAAAIFATTGMRFAAARRRNMIPNA